MNDKNTLYYYLGLIFLLNSGLVLLPIVLVLWMPSELSEVKYFLFSGGLLLCLGLSFLYKIRQERVIKKLSLKTSQLLLVLFWIISIGASALPFYIKGDLNFSQSIFESVSGWTTTGLSVVNVSKTPAIFLLHRSFTQFFGGVGIAIIMVASALGPNIRGLYTAEGRTDRLQANINTSAKAILLIYSAYTLLGIGLYRHLGMTTFDAVNHSIAAISTGGFSTHPNSIGAFKSKGIEYATIFLMLLGTINFAAHYLLLKGKFKTFFKYGELKVMGLLSIVCIPLVALFTLLPRGLSLSESFKRATFELISAITTTGFSLDDYGSFNDFAWLIFILLMIIGGGSGSTAGGVKQIRIYMLFKHLKRTCKKQLDPPKAVQPTYVHHLKGTASLTEGAVINLYNFLGLYLMIYLAGVFCLTALGYPLRSALFEFASCLSTVGLTSGLTHPQTPNLVLWIESMGMFLGRLEIVIVLQVLGRVKRPRHALGPVGKF